MVLKERMGEKKGEAKHAVFLKASGSKRCK